MLLIITNKEDFAVDYFITKLLAAKKPYFRLNSEDLTNAKYHFSCSNKMVSKQIQVEDQCLNLNDVTSVWYRRKPYLNNLDIIPLEQRRYVSGEILSFIEGFLTEQDLVWVNQIDNVDVGERKLYQLKLATELEFDVPDTIISNDPKELEQFFELHDGNVICKPIYHGLLATEGGRFSVYTSKVSRDDILDIQRAKVCPTLFQKRVEKGYDIRVTCIGNRIFPVRIFKEGDMPLDWREIGEEMQYESISLPKSIEQKCIRMLECLGLNYGAFDFVEKPDGNYVFLEINPTGEWVWLERELELQMSEAFISLFFD